ncbi:MAG: roadblock/LC7 domain-containing protein [Candidatus Hodarchaeales archaeon]|jgi:predicted regulator of Ras-like GTPase activity (Roadblock/LC7/MglB family)
MGINLTKDQRQQIMKMLQNVVKKCDLEALALVTKDGFKIEFHSAIETDSELFSSIAASCDNIGSLVCMKMNQGNLKEIIVWGSAGYTLLCPIGSEYILIGASKEMFSLGKTSIILREHAEELPNRLKL